VLDVPEYEYLSVFRRQGSDAAFQRFPQLLALKCFGGNFPPISKILRAILAFLVCTLLIDGLV
jgi:hypothetical protein